MASPARPHTARAPHLRCETWSRAPSAPAVASGPDRRDRFLERLEQPGALVAHVRRVQATAPCGRRDQGHELVRGGVHPGRVDQPGREPERAGVQRGLDLTHHRPAFIVGGGAGLGAHHGPAHRPLPDEERDVQPEALLGDRIQVLPERAPAGHELVRAQGQRDDLAPGIGDGCERLPAVAGQLRRVPLAQVADEAAVHEQRAVRVTVRVDEPRRHDETRGVDHVRDARRRRPPTGRRSRGSGHPAPRRPRDARATRCHPRRCRRAEAGRRRSRADDDTAHRH